MSESPPNSQTLSQEPRRAPPVGRALRILLGLVLTVYVAPVFFRVPVGVAVGSLLLVLGLVGVYSLIHIVLARRILPMGPRFGAVVANGLWLRCIFPVPPVCRLLAMGKVS